MNWDEFHMKMAYLVASKSKDPSTKVGAVIADSNNRTVSQGYNGPPRKVSDDYKSREQKYLRTIHAELNAIFFANRDLATCTIYVTHSPCARCAANIIQNGITRVVFPTASDDFMSRWADDMNEALLMFQEAGIEVVYFEEKETV